MRTWSAARYRGCATQKQDHRRIGDVLAGGAPVNELRALRVSRAHAIGERFHHRDRHGAGSQALPRELGNLGRVESRGLGETGDGVRRRLRDDACSRFRSRQGGLEIEHRLEDRRVRENVRHGRGRRKTVDQAHDAPICRKNRLVIAAEMNFKIPGVRRGGLSDQCGSAFGGNHREDRVVLVERIAGEIHTRVQMLQESARENDQVDVRGLRRFVKSRVRSLSAARPHCLKNANAVFIRSQSSETAKCRIAVDPVGISLPQFDQGIRNGNAVAIENTAREPYALPRSARSGDASKIHVAGEMKKRADRLGSGRDKNLVHNRCSNGVSSRPRRTMSKE